MKTKTMMRVKRKQKVKRYSHSERDGCSALETTTEETQKRNEKSKMLRLKVHASRHKKANAAKMTLKTSVKLNSLKTSLHF